ncbi:MAG: glucose-6-phosphate isomerase [Candidatus Cloacimonadales bacterium]|jgi:glucose-6-phosphate isomerase|nr:glucose-6-phosphate isomerase [Candidatus Cloacimonadota bacterium]MDX9977465.1 glucose-6-phosphate isomerase [Candidatus Cloacimonadales bacterium]
MSIKFDYANLLKNKKIQCGVSIAEIENNRHLCDQARIRFEKEYAMNILGFHDLPDYNVEHIVSYIESIEKDYDDMVVLGIGGSALGNKAIYNSLKTVKKLNKRLFVMDNVDPLLIEDIMSQVDLQRTLFNVITKSGTTAETMSTFLIVLDILKKKCPDTYKKQIIVTTDKEKGFLRQLIKEDGYMDFIVPDSVGGRFSVLTDVGLVSSAFIGVDIKALLKGAANMRKRCSNKDIWQNPAYLNAMLHYLYMQKGKNMSVMMPYTNALYDFADWYRQLWAESLGKRYNIDGALVEVGQTPIKALGTTDQHSQIQLYAEGPNDKVISFLTVEKFDYDYKIANIFPNNDEVNYLADKNISELLLAERLATEIALTNAGRPNCNIIFPELNEYNIGEFIYLYELQTVIAGYFLDINPLDQPGVEAGKIATYALMGKKGFAEQAKEIHEYNQEKTRNGRII